MVRGKRGPIFLWGLISFKLNLSFLLSKKSDIFNKFFPTLFFILSYSFISYCGNSLNCKYSLFNLFSSVNEIFNDFCYLFISSD